MKNSWFYNCSSKSFDVSLVLILLSVVLSCCKSKDIPPPENPAPEPKFKALCYGPYRDNEDPDMGIQPTIKEITEDLHFIKNLTNCIRIYGVTDSLVLIPEICDQIGLDCYPGAWISQYMCENDKQINGLLDIAKQQLGHVKGLIVGNEVLLRNDVSEAELIGYITQVKNATSLPVATAEIASDWLQHPKLVDAVDIMFVHIYPYWDQIPIENAASYILQRWNELKNKYPGKKMVIGETGWPSEGETQGAAIPSEANQKKFITEFLTLTDVYNIDYFYFEIFDEAWKSRLENTTGIHWGIYNTNGSLKQHLSDIIPASGQTGIVRPPRQVFPTIAALPLIVYSDGCSPDNKFYSSGWMGELGTLGNDSSSFNPKDIIDESCDVNQHSGSSCIRVSYKPSVDKYGGIYWQFPVNNWGKYPGYDLSKSVNITDSILLSFWARGKNGGEIVKFIVGGINNESLPNHDSFDSISTGFVSLKTDWQEYILNLTGEKLSMLIGGFCWVTDYTQSPNGVTFYLDDIIIKKVDK